MSSLPPLPPPALVPDLRTGATVQMVVEVLGARIASGDYARGSRLPAERQLAAGLQVARNTLREALDILESRGLITRRAGAGSFVALAEPDDLAPPAALAAGPLHLQVMRAILEPEMVRLAIVNMAPAAVDRLGQVLDQMRAASDPARFARCEEQFHLRLAEGTGNPLLVGCYELVVKARRQRYRAGLLRRRLTPDGMRLLCDDYAALAEAVADRDIPRALNLVQQMLLDEQSLLTQEA